MYPNNLEKIIYPLGSRQEWFENYTWTTSSPQLQDGLNTGITNFFESQYGDTDCTNANMVFGGDLPPRPSRTRLNEEVRFGYSAPYNFWSCAFYPNFTSDFRTSSVPVGYRAFPVGRKMDISLSSSQNVVAFLSTCLTAYCGNSQYCEMASCANSQLTLNGSMLSAGAVDNCLDQICYNNPETSSDPDIAGVGVVTSYIIQSVISYMAFIILFTFVYRLRKTVQDIFDYEAKLEKREAWLQAAVDTLLIGMDDFQRAQCCFGLAMNIASMITLQQKVNNITNQDRKAIALASTLGTTPTVVNLIGLMAMNERRSGLTFWVTFTTWISSLIVGLHPTVVLEYADFTSPGLSYPKECGGLSPAQVCGYNSGPAAILTIPMYIQIASMLFLTAWHLWPNITHLFAIFYPETTRRAPPRIHTGLSPTGTKNPRSQSHIFWFALITVIVMANFTISIAALFEYVLGALVRGDVNKEWSYGQVVAVTVWLPSLLSFINDLIYGPLRGRTQQLPNSLKLVRLPLVRVDRTTAKTDKESELWASDGA